LVAFRSTIVHEQSGGASIDTNNIQTKVTVLGSQWEIVSIGLNADETLLGALTHNQHGCFVHIYDVLTLSVDVIGEAISLCTIRVGNSASKGIAFEWNPALSDMFAASDNDRTLSIAKVDMSNQSKYSILGEKKLEANINEISWSPKGKQLVVGDANGKIFQLKPELELVRATNAPESAGGLAVTSLSWLSTTEWLVAYVNEQRSNGGAFMLNIKKDKPPSWTPMNLSGQFSFGETRRLLVDWNVAIVALPGPGQLLGVCKPPNVNAWSTIPLASLPQPSPTSFLCGIAVDLSMQSPIALGDGSSRRLPLILALNSDGSLRSFKLMPPSKDYPDCNVSLVPIDAGKIKQGLRAVEPNSSQKILSEAPSVTPLSQSTTPITGLFAKMGEQKSSTSPFSTVPPTGGLFGGSNVATQSLLNVGTTSGSMIPSTQPSGTAFATSLPPAQTTPKSSLTQAATNVSSVFEKPSTTPALPQQQIVKPTALSGLTTAQPPSLSSITQEKTALDIAEATKAAISVARSSAKDSVEKFSKAWRDSHKDLHSFSINWQKSGSAIDEAISSLTHAENSETADEIQRMVVELDEELCDILRLITEKKEMIKEKTATYKESRDIELSYRQPLNLLEALFFCQTASKPRRVSHFDPKFEGRIHESMKNMARYFAIVRARVDDIERKVLHITTQKQLNSNATLANQSLSNSVVVDHVAYGEVPSSIFITSRPKPIAFERGVSKSQQRAKMLELMANRKEVKTITKKVELMRIDCGTSDDTLSSSFLNAPNLDTSLLQKISSPLKVKPVLTMRNASTQADVPSVAPPTLAQTHSVSSALSSLATSKQAITNAADISKTVDDKKLNSTGIVPLATSTPGFKLGENPLKPSGSLFSSTVASATPHVSSAGSLGSASTELNPLGGKSIFGGLQSTVKPASSSADSQPLFASTPKTTTAASESKSLFGGLGLTGTLTAEKKDEKKGSSLFNNLGSTVTAESEKKEEKKSLIFGALGSTNNITSEKKDDKSPSLFGSKVSTESPTAENKETKPTSLFGGTANQTTPKSIFGGDSSVKPLSFTTSQPDKPSGSENEKDKKDESSDTKVFEAKVPEVKSGGSLFSSTAPATTTVTTTTTTSNIFGSSSIISTAPSSTSATTTSSSIFGAPSVPTTTTATTTPSSIFGAPKTTTSKPSAFGSLFGAKDSGAAQGASSASNTVTFSFKPRTEAEASQPAASFTFAPKPSGSSLGFAAAAAAAASTDNDEGMDDDGVTGATPQGTSSIFGGGFMSGIGSTTGTNANKNVFGMGTSNLLKNTTTQPTTSLFKGGQTSLFGANPQSSSFASAAQQAAQSNTSPSSAMSKSVFGGSPKFGGPPVFGGKPVFGSPTTQQTSAFGGASATSGGFSSFSGNKNLFGGATSGSSSLFGGGTSNQSQQKSSLFGGGQPSSSFSTWR
ncbi:hypothetical protein NECAME_15714, partial [Necator americanus]